MMTSIFRRKCMAFIFLSLALILAGCATTTANLRPEVPAMHTIAEFSDDYEVIHIPDPWERFNRSMYRFNYNFDKYIFLPVVTGYEFITPTTAASTPSNARPPAPPPPAPPKRPSSKSCM